MIAQVEGEVDGHNARLLPRSIQEGFFPNRHPFRYSTCPTGLNFSEHMGIKHLLLDKLYMYLQRIPYTVANCTIHLNETKYNLGKGKLTKPMHQFCLGYLKGGTPGRFAGALPCALAQVAFPLLASFWSLENLLPHLLLTLFSPKGKCYFVFICL